MDQPIMRLDEALRLEMQRARELIGHYEKQGSAGAFGTALLKVALKRADKALTDNDAFAMLAARDELRRLE